MDSRKATVALLAVAGLVLVTNSLWLYPNAGEVEYTYERSEITVENGTLTYDGVETLEFRRANDLQAVGCQWSDREGERACAFDAYLADNPPVSVPRRRVWGHVSPTFVEIDGGYYRRIHRRNGSNVTHDITPVSPESVLRGAATDVSDHSTPDRDDAPLEYYVAVTGETVTAEERLDRDDLGDVYRQNGSYYTVVGTDRTVHRPVQGFHQSEPLRYGLGMVGAVLLLAAGLLEVTRRSE